MALNDDQQYNIPFQIAFADDHLLVRKSIISLLEAEGNIKVLIEADNGKSLIEAIEKSSVKPEVCLMDIQMPVMNGFEAAAIIRSRWPEIKILVLSAFRDELQAIRIIRMGINGYLPKNCAPAEISKALAAIRKYGVYFTDFFAYDLLVAAQKKEAGMPLLSETEIQLLKYSCTELTYAEIAARMKTTTKKVEGYRDRLHKKLGVKTKVGLAMFAIRSGIVPIGTTPE